MEKCRFLLLITCLTCTVGFPLYAHGYPDRYVMVKPLHKKDLHNIIKPINLAIFQDTAKVINTEIPLKNETSQIKGELQNGVDSQNIKRAQNLSGEMQIGEEPLEKTKIKFVDNQLIIENLLEDGLLEIYNIMGVKVYNRHIKSGTNQHFLSLPKGYYIIRIGKLTRKIAIK